MKFTVYVFLAICILSADSDPCCQRSHWEQCNVFGPSNSTCEFISREHNGHGGCAPIMSNRSQSVPDGLDVINFSYELTPCSADPGWDEDNCSETAALKMITLSLSITLDGPNLSGILFILKGYNEVISHIRHNSCHYIKILERLEEKDVKENGRKTKLFYDGFYNETIHPGYTYEVSGRSLPAPTAQDYDVVVNKKVTIPHCGDLPERDSIYLCSLPSPGKWTTTISNNWTETADRIYTVDVIFTVINDADFYVVGFSTDQQNLHQKRIENDMSEWRWEERHGSYVIQQTYINVTAGVYYFLVAPNYPESCADPHWGITHCPQFSDQILVSEESTSKSSTTEYDVLTTPVGHERGILPTLNIILIVTGIFFVLVGCCLFLYCCCKYWSKYFWCYENNEKDFVTVTSKFQQHTPRPLIPPANTAKYRMIYPEDGASTVTDFDMLTVTASLAGPDFRKLDLPDRETYTQLQQDFHLPPTPDEGYHETSHPQMSVNPWRFNGGAVRQDSGISVVSNGQVEEHGMEMGYDDTRLRSSNGGYHPISQSYDPNQPNLPVGGVRRQISKETTM